MGTTDFGTLGGNSSWAEGVNNAGQVVGKAYTSNDATVHAFITGPNGVGMTDLNSLVNLLAGAHLSEAIAINHHDQVLAIPEPESYALTLPGSGWIHGAWQAGSLILGLPG